MVKSCEKLRKDQHCLLQLLCTSRLQSRCSVQWINYIFLVCYVFHQYRVVPPLFLMQASSVFGSRLICASICKMVNAFHAWRMRSFRSVSERISSGEARIWFLRSCQTGSIGEKSGDFEGWGNWRTLLSCNHFRVSYAVWIDALSCWNQTCPLSDTTCS